MQLTRHKHGDLSWYRVGEFCCVYPFTRSRMNRKTLGKYGRSARTKPIVTTRLWAAGYMNSDGTLPSAADTTSGGFRAPQFHLAFDLKKDAIHQAKKMEEAI